MDKTRNKMIVTVGSSVNADTLTISVEVDGENMFMSKYYYGDTVSHNSFFASAKKPLDEDLISRLAKKYKVDKQNIVRIRSVNLYNIGG